MLPVGDPYFLNLSNTDLTADPKPADPVSNLTPTRPTPLYCMCPGDAPNSML